MQTQQNDVKESPMDAIFLALAALYEQVGQVDSALGIYNNILKRSPNCVGALVGRGIIMLLKMQDERALKDLHKAVAMAPRSRISLRARGLAYMLNTNWEAADKDFRKSFEQNDWDSLSVLIAFALAQKYSGQDKAQQLLNEALEGKIKNQDWPFAQLQFMRGDIPMTTLMAIANTKGRQLEIRAYSGFISAYGNNPPEGKADLAFVSEAKTGSPLIRLLAARGLMAIEGNDKDRLSARMAKADGNAKMDWLD